MSSGFASHSRLEGGEGWAQSTERRAQGSVGLDPLPGGARGGFLRRRGHREQDRNTTGMSKESKYSKRGVSSTKEDVHEAIKNIDKGLYPKAFCKIVPDILGHDPSFCNI
ncbi:MAG: hypothetical protein WAL29_12445, partial [Bacteroidales bacterium]